MAEVEKYVFDYKEIVTELVKKQNIHEGIWALYIEFGIAAANVAMRLALDPSAPAPKEPPTEVTPTAIIPIQKIGIVRTDQLNSISVDAAEVNPKPKTGGKKSK